MPLLRNLALLALTLLPGLAAAQARAAAQHFGFTDEVARVDNVTERLPLGISSAHVRMPNPVRLQMRGRHRFYCLNRNGASSNTSLSVSGRPMAFDRFKSANAVALGWG